eukprot:1141511-Pelagomonas_calceolata.AAC.3
MVCSELAEVGWLAKGRVSHRDVAPNFKPNPVALSPCKAAEYDCPVPDHQCLGQHPSGSNHQQLAVEKKYPPRKSIVFCPAWTACSDSLELTWSGMPIQFGPHSPLQQPKGTFFTATPFIAATAGEISARTQKSQTWNQQW